MSDALPDLSPAAPEIFVVVAGMALLLLGVFARGNPMRLIAGAAVAVLLAAAVWTVPVSSGVTTFSGMFIADAFARFAKILVLGATAFTILLSLSYAQRENMDRFELPLLMLFAAAGMMLMISANDLIVMYVGLEMQSLALYVVAAFKRDTLRSTEAGLKYFVLSALASGMLLYGLSLVYGFAGTTSFDVLATTLAGEEALSIGLIVALVFVVAGLAFKISAVPFHMWTPDVYEGAPTPVTAFFAAAPKVAALAMAIRLLVGPFETLLSEWQQIIVAVSALSMVLGAFAAINQRNIKRLMAYSSIGHMGYALVGLAAGTEAGVHGMLVYLAVYLVMTLGTFAVILTMHREGQMVEQIDDLAGMWKTHPMTAIAMFIFMFSMIGIPPFAGFFAKFYVFRAAVNEGLFVLAVLGVLTSVVAAFYYLRIVKVMYFDEPRAPFDRPIGAGTGTVLSLSGLFTLVFFLWPGPLIVSVAGESAAALFGG